MNRIIVKRITRKTSVSKYAIKKAVKEVYVEEENEAENRETIFIQGSSVKVLKGVEIVVGQTTDKLKTRISKLVSAQAFIRNSDGTLSKVTVPVHVVEGTGKGLSDKAGSTKAGWVTPAKGKGRFDVKETETKNIQGSKSSISSKNSGGIFKGKGDKV